MRGILSQMHKIKSQRNSKSLQKDRLEMFQFFFVLCLYMRMKDSRDKMNTKICATHNHKLTRLRVSPLLT